MLLGGESRGIRLPITRRWRPLWLGFSLPSTSTARSHPLVLSSLSLSFPLTLYSPRNTPDITLNVGGKEEC